MKKYLFSTPSLFLLLLRCSAVVYMPKDDIAVNCGSNGSSTDPSTRSWTGDQNSKYSPIDDNSESSSSTTSIVPQRSGIDNVPYGSVRLSSSPFNYSFPVTVGPKFIRLHFYPFNYATFSRTDAYFSVTSGSYTLLRNFSAALTADYLKFPVFFREFCVNVGDNEKWLNLTFTPTTNQPNAYAFINGIEVVSMPDNLYYGDLKDDLKGLTTETTSHQVKFLGDNVRDPYTMSTTVALETMYRINVGGSPISPKDTGMYRTWEGPDDKYVWKDPGSSVLPLKLTMQLNFTMIPNYTAPEDVYRSARSMGRNGTVNEDYNLTWSFLVDTNFYYLVRLHFCDIVDEMNKREDRSFRIFIATITAQVRADIIRWTLSKDVPYCRDYVVDMFDDENKKVKLDIAIRPEVWGVDTRYADAMLNGLEIFKISNGTGNLAGPNPPRTDSVPPSTPLEPSSSKSDNKKVTIASIVGGVVSGIVVISLLGFLIFRRRKMTDAACSDGASLWGPLSFTTIKSTQKHDSSLPAGLCRNFSLAEIKAATNDFNKDYVVGKGGFGNVYKGYIDGGSIPVAIKRLNPESQQGAREFMTEIEMLSQLRHLHLVSLIGFCDDEGEMILVYDYMSRGTVREHLYNTDNPPLPWKQRLEICIGAARGLHYLHTGAKHLIIHRDMKTTNILLDDKWIAKVSDFGLSKIGPANLTDTHAHVTTMVKGTFGYLDPEYYRRQQLTEKSDVYSFGVVLFEVLCARPPVKRTAEKKQISLATWALNCFKNGMIDKIVDPNLVGCISPECLNKFAQVAVSCLHEEGAQRPSMADVAWSLEFALQLQETSEQGPRSPVEVMVRSDREDATPLIWSSEGGSDNVITNSNQSYFMTTTTSTSTSSDSEKVKTGMIFSDIMNPQGR